MNLLADEGIDRPMVERLCQEEHDPSKKCIHPPASIEPHLHADISLLVRWPKHVWGKEERGHFTHDGFGFLCSFSEIGQKLLHRE